MQACAHTNESAHPCVGSRARAAARAFVRTVAKKGEEGSEHDQLDYPWGAAMCVCVCK